MRESVAIIEQHGAATAGVVIAPIVWSAVRELSAVQEVRQQYGVPVVSVASLSDLIGFLPTVANLPTTSPRCGSIVTYGIDAAA